MSTERSANTIDRKLGARVRARRLELGMSQEHLAEALGITFQQVQKYEKGVNRIATSRLIDISDALGMAPARLIEGFETAPKADQKKAHGASAPDTAIDDVGAGELLRLYASIKKPKLRRRVLELVRAMAEAD